MPAHEFLLVDAFADGPLTGNPAAVVLLDHPTDDAQWMQRVAAEMNQSETAFVSLREDQARGQDQPLWNLRWFTPRTEVDLCGHATLASAHALWATGRLAADQGADFRTRSGLLRAWRMAADAGASAEIELDLPARPERDVTLTHELSVAFDQPLQYVGRNQDDFVVELDDEAAVRAVSPSRDALLAAGGRGFIVTARADADAPYDFVLRFFAPAVGVDEDPVTGSALACLGPYWAQRLGRGDLIARQLSARGGTVSVRTAGDRVRLGGRAVTVVQGVLRG
ncbi:MAG: PhzF family phenazine biosynthesis protein [Alphaproteobacteria bacterium]|nr:PhzF family phenazine biosynthesis protein [Alphaproteobacteria bacterium]